MSTDGNQNTNNDVDLTKNTPVTGVPNKTRVVKVQGNSIPTTAAVENKTQVPNTVQNRAQQPAVNNPDDLDIDKFISESTAEIKTGEEKETERKKKTDYLTKALESRARFERIIFSNSETGEFVGTKLQYVKDEDGKSIYDYMNDPIVTEHIEFIVPEGDPQDGSPVNQQVSFFWKKPTF